jgi:branched-chain amino acid transport system substrate-binding protein
MSNTAKWAIGVIVVVVVIILIAKAGRGDKQAVNNQGTNATTTQTGTIKIGVLLPLTGDAASYGEPAQNIMTIATDEINKAGGIDGKNIELVVQDGKCNGRDAANAASKLINTDKVQIIIGGFCSSESLSALPIAEAAKVALFSAGSSSPDLTGKSHYFFRNYVSDATQGAVMAELANKQGMKKVVFIQEQLDYPLGIYKAFTARFQALGGTVVKEEFPSTATDFRSSLTKLRGQNPDALFIDTQTGAGTERILKQLADLKWTPKLFLNDAVAGDTKTMEANKAQVEGAFAAEFGVDQNNPTYKHLLEAYIARHGGDVLPYASYGQTEYDAVFMVRDAIKAVGYDGTKIADWARSVKDWQGASGKITIGQDGDRVGGHQVKILKNGKTEVYNQ